MALLSGRSEEKAYTGIAGSKHHISVVSYTTEFSQLLYIDI